MLIYTSRNFIHRNDSPSKSPPISHQRRKTIDPLDENYIQQQRSLLRSKSNFSNKINSPPQQRKNIAKLRKIENKNDNTNTKKNVDNDNDDNDNNNDSPLDIALMDLNF